MDRMETAIESLGGKDAEKARLDMSMACNTYGLSTDVFLELMKSQKPKVKKLWTMICWHWITNLSKNHLDNELDARNKQACYTGYRIYQSSIYRDEPLTILFDESFISVFIRKMARDHRTIQQSFSSLVFAWLDYLATEKKARKETRALAEIKKERGDKWYRMPLI
jgi:hypothetical protein